MWLVRWPMPTCLGMVILLFLRGVLTSAQTPDRWQITADPSGNLVGFSNGGSSPPSLVRNPASRIVELGAMGALSLNVMGTPPMRYQWFFNDNPLARATNDSLLITNFGVAQVGNYFAMANNSFGSVTSTTARLEVDANGDGLPDAWQLAAFGALTNQNAYTDFDRDAVNNLEEWLEGTHPAKSLDLRPRLEVVSLHGTVEVTPNRLSYASNEIVTLRAQPDPGWSFIGWVGDLAGATNPASILLTSNRTIQAVFGWPLDRALSTTNKISMGGTGGWLGANVVSPQSPLAARVGIPFITGAPPQDPWLETQVTLARDGVASFWWKMDGYPNDVLHLWVDTSGQFQDTRTLTGQTGWQFKGIFLSAGAHKIRWQFVRGAFTGELPASSRPEATAYVQSLEVKEYPDPTLDTDGHGLPDLWEYKYFDQLGNDPNADPDKDGVSNSVESADKTDPTYLYSVVPSVTLSVEGGGTASLLAHTNRFTSGATITNAATAASGWGWLGWIGPFHSDEGTLSWVTNNPVTDRLNLSKHYVAVFGLPLGPATGLPGTTWSTGELVPWYGQTNETHNGLVAARSGRLIRDYGETWLETSVVGPGTLAFWWKVDSVTNRDTLALLVNGQEQPGAISGNTGWQLQNQLLSSGTQGLRWRFKAVAYETNVTHSAWLSEVSFTSGSTVPQFVHPLNDVTVYEGSDVSISAPAAGTLPISYQLFQNNIPYGSPGTNSVMTIKSISSAQAGAWQVRAVNTAGQKDSATFQIQVIPIPTHDLFVNRVALAQTPVRQIGYTFGAKAETGEKSHAGWSARHSVWYRWTAPSAGNLRITLTATNLTGTVILGVYSGSTLSALSAVGEASASGKETNGVTVAQASVLFAALAGVEYSMVVDDTANKGVDFVLELNPAPPPANDFFAHRTVIYGPAVNGADSLWGATLETGEPSPFGYFQILKASVWWSWTPSINGDARLISQAGSFSPVVTLYRGSTLTSLTMLASTLTNVSGLSTGLHFLVLAGETYQIQVGTRDTTGDYLLNIALPQPSVSLGLRRGPTNLVEFTLEGQAGKNYEIEASVDLFFWWPVTRNQADFSGAIRFTEPWEDRRQLFYRARLLPD